MTMDLEPRREATTSPGWGFVLYAGGAAFATYFCMYGLRKPVDVTIFKDIKFLATRIDLKTACVLGQILGYAVSKFVGARVCSEARRDRRLTLLVAAAVAAEFALVAFALVPDGLKPLAMLANGLPLGVVWGLVVRYLEGRRSSDLLLTILSGSIIIAGAATKDAAMYLLTDWKLAEPWIPAATGGLFLLPYLLSVWMLDRVPPPDARDEHARTARASLDAAGRRAFLARVGVGFFLLVLAYFLMTAYRDFRDHYGREILKGLGHEGQAGIFVRTDRWALVGALFALAFLTRIGNHRRALGVVVGVILTGFGVIGLATAAFQAGWITGMGWFSAVGVGLYLAYVPFGAVLFERVVAAARFPGTSVFAVQLTDGFGYTGSMLLQVYRDLAHPDIDRTTFFAPLSYTVAAAGAVLTLVGAAKLRNRIR